MGARSGDLDPEVMSYLACHTSMSIETVEGLWYGLRLDAARNAAAVGLLPAECGASPAEITR
jgi:hypothetical protein